MVVSNTFGAIVFTSVMVIAFLVLFVISKLDDRDDRRYLTEPESDPIIKSYLEDNGYTSIEDWAQDSDYVWRNGAWGEGWYDRISDDDEWRGPYDVREQLLTAINQSDL